MARRLRRAYLRPVLLFITFVLILDTYYHSARRPHTTLAPLHHTGSAANETVFIASIHRNSGGILREAWSDAMVDLVCYLGLQNVHFSAVESGSQDNTKEQLLALKEKLDELGVSNTFSLGKTVWEQLDEINGRPEEGESRDGWVWNSGERRLEMRRISYLARERNLAMAPLKTLETQGRKFDKILWFNDVVFDTQDIVTLLSTRDGQYAAACAMDFTLYPYYYDTFALRDTDGRKTASWYWPWFHSRAARASALASEPIQVLSCWNGVVAFDAAPFYAEPMLKFRGVSDSLADLHIEGSECCLIHADNYLSREKGVWLNPNVRVGYNVPVYKQVKGDRFPTAWAAVVGAWANRWLRWRNGIQLALERWTVEKRLAQWIAETPDGEPSRHEPGDVCLINEMQIMWQNGWKHI